MDTQDLISHARARFAHEAAKRVLKEKYQARLVFGYNGGMWRADQNLMVLLQAIHTQEAVILDLYENPVRINVLELSHRVSERFQEVMNAWLVEFESISTKR